MRKDGIVVKGDGWIINGDMGTVIVDGPHMFMSALAYYKKIFPNATKDQIDSPYSTFDVEYDHELDDSDGIVDYEDGKVIALPLRRQEG